MIALLVLRLVGVVVGGLVVGEVERGKGRGIWRVGRRGSERRVRVVMVGRLAVLVGGAQTAAVQWGVQRSDRHGRTASRARWLRQGDDGVVGAGAGAGERC